MKTLIESLTYIFKEAGTFKKLIIAFGLYLPFFILNLLLSLSTPSLNYSRYSGYGETSPLILPLVCLMFIGLIVYLFANYWFFYENAKAVFEKRETNDLTKYNFNFSLKRAGKLTLLELIYSLIIFIFVFCIACFFGLIVSLGASSAANNIDVMLSGVTFGFLGLICLAIPLALTYQYLIVDPARMRLIYTNTFSEGLKVKENISLVTKNFGIIVRYILIEVALFLAYVMLYFVIAFAVGTLVGGYSIMTGGYNPATNLIMQLVLFPLVVLSFYYATFIRPHLVASYYKRIFEK